VIDRTHDYDCLPVEEKSPPLFLSAGDDGDNFYLVDSGSVEVFVAGKGDEPVKSYNAGDGFGELVRDQLKFDGLVILTILTSSLCA